MKQSRRLMVILTSGSGSESKESTEKCHSLTKDSVTGGFDWQASVINVVQMWYKRDTTVNTTFLFDFLVLILVWHYTIFQFLCTKYFI